MKLIIPTTPPVRPRSRPCLCAAHRHTAAAHDNKKLRNKKRPWPRRGVRSGGGIPQVVTQRRKGKKFTARPLGGKERGRDCLLVTSIKPSFSFAFFSFLKKGKNFFFLDRVFLSPPSPSFSLGRGGGGGLAPPSKFVPDNRGGGRGRQRMPRSTLPPSLPRGSKATNLPSLKERRGQEIDTLKPQATKYRESLLLEMWQ